MKRKARILTEHIRVGEHSVRMKGSVTLLGHN